MLYSPARSPESDSNRLLGRPARSLRNSALSSTVSRRVAWSVKPWNSGTNSPAKNRSVLRSLKLRIIIMLYVISIHHVSYSTMGSTSRQAYSRRRSNRGLTTIHTLQHPRHLLRCDKGETNVSRLLLPPQSQGEKPPHPPEPLPPGPRPPDAVQGRFYRALLPIPPHPRQRLGLGRQGQPVLLGHGQLQV